MRAFVFSIACLTVSTAALAQTVEQPIFKSGDHWVYRMTTEKAPNSWVQTRDEFTISRVTASAIYLSVKQSGSTQPPNEIFAGLDWSRIRNVNGKETVVNRPFAFPLTIGKTWNLRYEEDHPQGTNFKSQLWESKYTVVSFETIEVPAGKFKALKIESEGDWVGEIAPRQNVVQGAQITQGSTSTVTRIENTPAGTKATGRIYRAFWYVPEVKRWVKSVEEYYAPSGSRNERYTAELESFNGSGT